MAENFTYTQLDLIKQEFRLLRILPAQDDRTIECEIITELFGNLPYKALSYTWGKVEPLPEQSRIILNGRPFPIRRNLLSFFHVARQQDEMKRSWLWIDAICIDQANIPERNSQVQFMDKIYKQAEEVCAWLGPAGDNSDWVVDVIRSVPEAGHAAWDEIQVDKGFRAPNHEANGSLCYEAVELPPEEKKAFELLLEEKKAFEALMRRPYWRRVWVVQELLLGKQVRFLCGQKEFSWGNMINLIINVAKEKAMGQGNENKGERLLNPPENNFLHFPTRIFSRKSFFVLSPRDFLWVALSMFADFECAEPRDRVYGLQSLVPPEGRVAVDYSKSMEEIFHDVMVKLREDTFSNPEWIDIIERSLRRKWNLEDSMPLV